MLPCPLAVFVTLDANLGKCSLNVVTQSVLLGVTTKDTIMNEHIRGTFDVGKFGQTKGEIIFGCGE